MRRPLLERFEAKVSPEPTSGCWLWTAYLMPNGYGLIGRGGSGEGMEYAHRAAWMLYRGPVPAGRFVCHRCDNRACVNPDHLFLGTHADNMRDMSSKRRSAVGSRNGQARLSPQSASEARRMKSSGIPQAQIARALGVSPMTISRLVRGQSWRG